MKLLELPTLKSGDLNFKACDFKFLIVVPLFCNILFYFNFYSSLEVTSRLRIYIIKLQYWKFKRQTLSVTVFNLLLILQARNQELFRAGEFS